MAMVEKTKESEIREENRESLVRVEIPQIKDYTSSSVKGILKSITWPSIPKALKYTIGCMAASAVIAVAMYLYQYGITSIISTIQ